MRHAIILSATTSMRCLRHRPAVAAPVAQAQQKQPPQKGPPPPAPAKPYTPIAVKLPAPFNDPSFEAFRKQLGEIAREEGPRRPRQAGRRAGLLLGRREGRPGRQEEVRASTISRRRSCLGGKQPVGWDMLQGYAADPTATAYPGKQGVICAPADPQFDEKQLEERRQGDRHRSGRLGLSARRRRRGPRARRAPMRRSRKSSAWC